MSLICMPRVPHSPLRDSSKNREIGFLWPFKSSQSPNPLGLVTQVQRRAGCLLLAGSFIRMAIHQKNAWSTRPSSMGMCYSPSWLSSGPCPRWALTLLKQAVWYVVNAMWLRVGGKANEENRPVANELWGNMGQKKVYVAKIPFAEL